MYDFPAMTFPGLSRFKIKEIYSGQNQNFFAEL